MPDTQARLIGCFQAVFPELSEADIKRASVNHTSAWDSIATVTLAATVEEEFGVQLAGEELEKLTSFDRFLSRLDQPARAAVSRGEGGA